MMYNLYELADIYKFSVRYFQKKLNEYIANTQRTASEPVLLKKDNRTALQNEDLKGFLAFCGLEEKTLNEYTANTQRTDSERPANSQRTDSEQKSKINDTVFNSLLGEKEKRIEEYQNQINYLKKLIEDEKNEKTRIEKLRAEEGFRKDILIKELIGEVKRKEEVETNIKNLNRNIIKSIEYSKEKTFDIIDTDKPRIAVVEDNQDFADILKMNLEKENYNVIHFDNVTEAGVHYIKKAFQLTLLDLKLTEKDDFSGEKFWELIKKHNVDTPVIIISGEEDERIEKAKKIINPIAIFKKPLNIGNLIKKLKEIL